MMIIFVLILDCFHSRKSSPCHCGLPQASDGGGAGAAVVGCSLGSKHSQAEQYCVLTSSPQQSPPSYPHPALLFSSSQ